MTFKEWMGDLYPDSDYIDDEAKQLIEAVWNAARRIDRDELKSILQLLDGLAEQWGDEAVFRRCRDRLRKVVSGMSAEREGG